MTRIESLVEESGRVTEDILAHAVLGGGLSADAERHLDAASRSYHLDDVAETHLREAEALAPDHVAVLIGLYRFYFYKGRLGKALEIAEICLKKAARENNIASDWRLVGAGDADFGCWDALWPRFFLFTLKGYAYLNMRLGRLAEGRHAASKLLELDPDDRMGAKLLLDILDRAEDDDGE